MWHEVLDVVGGNVGCSGGHKRDAGRVFSGKAAQGISACALRALPSHLSRCHLSLGTVQLASWQYYYCLVQQVVVTVRRSRSAARSHTAVS